MDSGDDAGTQRASEHLLERGKSTGRGGDARFAQPRASWGSTLWPALLIGMLNACGDRLPPTAPTASTGPQEPTTPLTSVESRSCVPAALRRGADVAPLPWTDVQEALTFAHVALLPSIGEDLAVTEIARALGPLATDSPPPPVTICAAVASAWQSYQRLPSLPETAPDRDALRLVLQLIGATAEASR